jgi:hypothetical protein
MNIMIRLNGEVQTVISYKIQPEIPLRSYEKH